jgi:hypothetical protein
MVSSYAAVDAASGLLRVMLINRDPDEQHLVDLAAPGVPSAAQAERYVYSPADLTQIVRDTVTAPGAITLPASSITVLAIPRS